MLARLLSRTRIQSVPPPHTPEPHSSERVDRAERLLLLIPEGGFAFRLHRFDSMESAQDYIQSSGHLLRPNEVVAFWARDSESGDGRHAASIASTEIAVMIRDESRQDIIQLYSFVGLEAARDFLRDSVDRGLDLSRVLLYWAVREHLDERTEREQESPRSATRQRVTHWPESTISLPGSQRDAGAETRVAGAGEQLSKHDELPETGVNDPAMEKQNVWDQPIEDRSKSATSGGFLAGVRSWQGWDRLAAFMVAAALLKSEAYDDLKRDPHATGRAWLIFGLGSIAAAVGGLGTSLTSAAWHAVAGPIGLAACMGSIYVIGTWIVGGRRQTVLRFFQAAALASSPVVMLVFGLVPVYGTFLVLAVSLWIAASMAVAAMAVLELAIESALLAAIIGWCFYFAISQVAPAVFAS